MTMNAVSCVASARPRPASILLATRRFEAQGTGVSIVAPIGVRVVADRAVTGHIPFAAVGSRVSEGQTVLIIEAMKTMNQIPAHRSGTITRILVEDSAPVEYGQPLAVIE